jgi:hypothetical protein
LAAEVTAGSAGSVENVENVVNVATAGEDVADVVGAVDAALLVAGVGSRSPRFGPRAPSWGDW